MEEMLCRGDGEMGKMDESIIVVAREWLFGDASFQGTEQSPEKVAAYEKKMATGYRTMRRGDAEENTAYKQPIPYAVLRQNGCFFTYRRLGGGAEQRLHDKLSIGVGGHMNRIEGETDFRRILKKNLERELHEELIVDGAGNAGIRTIGLINDDESEVGRVHIGILSLIDLPKEASVHVRERDKLAGSWRSLAELNSNEIIGRMESWSALALRLLTDPADERH
jgi:predicted NUDIX family phosphoesterase